jgi:hypothetical protein
MKLIMTLWAILLTAPMAIANAAAIEKPKGIFSSSGARSTLVINHSETRGVLIRVKWSDIEPSPGNFDFSQIEQQLTRIRSAGKSWSLAVLGGPSSPTWLYSPPYNVEWMNVTFRESSVKVPKFWDAMLQDRLAQLAAALAATYNYDSSLKLVYLPQMSSNGIEGHLNGNSVESLQSQGMTEDLWVSSVLQAATTFANEFTQKPIAIELHYILGSASAGQRIMDAIAADPAMLEQIGVAMWWLSGKTTYQPNLLSAIAKFPGDKYAQLIGASTQTYRFLNNEYTTAFTQAKSLGIKYVEPWEEAFKSGQWDDLLHDFNAYASE